jgi:2-oxoglutarate dehydrogenase E2 component (dihydrolipoamide succinyltransferase)
LLSGEKKKNAFEKREGEKLTYTRYSWKRLQSKDFPGLNISDGDYIIEKY